jgi:hypothetical protein
MLSDISGMADWGRVCAGLMRMFEGAYVMLQSLSDTYEQCQSLSNPEQYVPWIRAAYCRIAEWCVYDD